MLRMGLSKCVYTLGLRSYDYVDTKLGFLSFRIMLYLICCFTVLVPQQLIEFRYYIIPFLIFRIHIPKSHDWRLTASLCCELSLYSAINILTIYLFLYQPFQWPHLPGQTQRFMWWCNGIIIIAHMTECFGHMTQCSNHTTSHDMVVYMYKFVLSSMFVLSMYFIGNYCRGIQF